MLSTHYFQSTKFDFAEIRRFSVGFSVVSAVRHHPIADTDFGAFSAFLAAHTDFGAFSSWLFRFFAFSVVTQILLVFAQISAFSQLLQQLCMTYIHARSQTTHSSTAADPMVVVVIRNECLLSVIVHVCRAQLLNFWSKVML